MPLTPESQPQKFLAEAAALLQQIDRDLRDLETALDSDSILERLVHAAHLLRCGSAYFQLPSIELLAHRFKNVLQHLRGREFNPNWSQSLSQLNTCLKQLCFVYTKGESTVESLAQAHSIFTVWEHQLKTSDSSGGPRITQVDQGLVQQIYTTEFPLHLQQLEQGLAERDRINIVRTKAQELLGFGALLALSQLISIAQAALNALKAKPEAALEIGQLLLISCQNHQLTPSQSPAPSEGLTQLIAYASIQQQPTSPLTSFLTDATDWLNTIEQDLLNLDEHNPLPQIYNLMRVTHTIKGAALSANLDTVTFLARSQEEIYRSLCHPDITIDSALKGLLFQSYECFRLSLSTDNDEDVIQRAKVTFAQIRERLEEIRQDVILPTPDDLGVDVVASIFQDDVEQRLQALAARVKQPDHSQLGGYLHQQAEVLTGIAESFDLKGFKYIAQATIRAIATHPTQATKIAQLALADFQQGQARILAGDRTQGGFPSSELRKLAGTRPPQVHVEDTSHDAPPRPINVSGGISTVQTIRVAVEQLERLTQLTGVLLTSQKQQRSAHGQLNQRLEDLQKHCQGHLEQLQQLGDQADTFLCQPETSGALGTGRLKQERQLLEQFRGAAEEAEQLGIQLTAILQDHQQAEQPLKLQRQLLTDMRNHVLETQIITLEDLFHRLTLVFERLVTTGDKVAKLDLVGAEIPVERIVAEQLYDPLLHLLRNAYDHGIDAPETRQQFGKTKVAQVELRAHLQNQWTIIQVRDDGPGLNIAQIRERAVHLKLLSSDKADVSTEAELLALLFTPGFSTKSQVSDISGRGMGLNVVQTQLQQMGGSVTVRTQSQHGTTFELMIPRKIQSSAGLVSPQTPETTRFSQAQPAAPDQNAPPSLEDLFGNLERTIEPVPNVPQPHRPQITAPRASAGTVAVNPPPVQTLDGKIDPREPVLAPIHSDQRIETDRLFIWSTGATIYTLPYDHIEENVVPGQGRVTRTPQQQFLEWRGQQIPLYLLSEMLAPSVVGMGTGPTQLSQTTLLLVIRLGQQIFAIESTIDHLINGRQLSIHPLNHQISYPQYVYGQTALANGTPALLIDTIALLQQTFNLKEPSPQTLSSRSGTAGQNNYLTPPTTQKTLLIIDDSRMVRETLKQTLQSHYSLLEAQDGQAALDLAQTSSSALDAVICDVAMPRMNGLDFLRCCRQYPMYAEVPIMMLSSCNSEVHQRIALDLGATAYLTKPYVDQQLLTTLQDLVKDRQRV